MKSITVHSQKNPKAISATLLTQKYSFAFFAWKYVPNEIKLRGVYHFLCINPHPNLLPFMNILFLFTTWVGAYAPRNNGTIYYLSVVNLWGIFSHQNDHHRRPLAWRKRSLFLRLDVSHHIFISANHCGSFAVSTIKHHKADTFICVSFWRGW